MYERSEEGKPQLYAFEPTLNAPSPSKTFVGFADFASHSQQEEEADEEKAAGTARSKTRSIVTIVPTNTQTRMKSTNTDLFIDSEEMNLPEK